MNPDRLQVQESESAVRPHPHPIVEANRREVERLKAERDRYRAFVTDPRALWDAMYPHMTEDGPHLSLADCEHITRWLLAALDG